MDNRLTTETVTFKPGGAARRMLYVLAHPDDESFGPGGSIIRYGAEGVDVHLICATRGEAGTVDDHYLHGYDSIAALRTQELLCAAKPLGLTALHWLNYRDSGMPNTPENEHPQALVQAPTEVVAQRVATLIRQIQPQVIVTFDPIGGYRHPDHIAIHLATVRAFDMAADATFDDGQPPYQPQRLYFSTIDRTFFRVGVGLLRLFRRDPRKFGRNGDIDLVSLAEVDFPTHYKVAVGPYLGRKEQAGQCHASQVGPLQGRLGGWFFRLLGGSETFMQARPEVTGKLHGRDLWEGVRP